MDVVKTMKPHAPGAIKHRDQWKDKLVAVRYRKNKSTGLLYTTVEIIVDERELAPNRARIHFKNRIAVLKIPFGEVAIRKRVMEAGGVWDTKTKLWYLAHDKIQDLSLAHVVVTIRDGLPEHLIKKKTAAR